MAAIEVGLPPGDVIEKVNHQLYVIVRAAGRDPGAWL